MSGAECNGTNRPALLVPGAKSTISSQKLRPVCTPPEVPTSSACPQPKGRGGGAGYCLGTPGGGG